MAKKESEEKFSGRERTRRTGTRRVQRKRKSGWEKFSEDWNRMSKSWMGTFVYVALGVTFAFLASQLFSVVLNTDYPIVAVVSQSMQHDRVEVSHYKWLNDKFGYTREEIDSWPIAGGFLVGDMPIVQGVEGYRVGDVIVYSVAHESYPIIHRIIRINEDGTYQTKGDNNNNQLTYEMRVTESQIHGRVIFVIPKIGYFKVLLTNFLGI